MAPSLTRSDDTFTTTLKRTYVATEKDLEERRDEVVDALHVATRWMPDRPDVQYPL